jgi:hypothetical protein
MPQAPVFQQRKPLGSRKTASERESSDFLKPG